MGRVKSLPHPKIESLFSGIVYLENAWTSIQMITEGEAAILMETTLHAFRKGPSINYVGKILPIFDPPLPPP